MDFKIVRPIQEIDVIAQGRGIKNIKRLNKIYGRANWRKLKGKCTIELHNGAIREAEVHWYEDMASGKRKSNSRGTCEGATMKKHYMICVDNHGYEASLETRKLYQVLCDKEAEQNHQIRVIDESGEDYLYPEGYFAPVRLPSETKQKLELTAA